MVKERNLSTLDYYDLMQKEYIIAEIRRKIYFSPKDKKYYQKVLDYKKNVIEEISVRNSLNSIFNDEILMKKYRDMIYPIKGLPRFELTLLDKVNYYSLDSDVRVDLNDKSLLGKIVSFNIDENKGFIDTISFGMMEFNFNYVTRIL